MDSTPRGYRFGDVTKGMIRHWNDEGSVKNRLDWIKAGKALVDYLLAHGTISLGIFGLTMFQALKDPKDAEAIGAFVAALAGMLNLVRRIMSGKPPDTVPPKEPSGGQEKG